MKPETMEALDRIGQLRPSDWAAILRVVRRLQVGSARWEEAWLAARSGHAAAVAAQSRALQAGASPAAAAALAGATAALEARDQLSNDQFELLVRPGRSILRPPGIELAA